MLITKTVIIKWNSRNKKWFEEKGYSFTKMKGEFEVKVEDLTNGCDALVEIKCDGENCDLKTMKQWAWSDYMSQVKENGNTYCKKCSMKLFGGNKVAKTKLKDSISFAHWLIKNLSLNEAVSIISRWDYDLNNCSPLEISYKSNGINKSGYWFKCASKSNHKSEIKNIGSFTGGHSGSINCKACSSIAYFGVNTVCPDFLERYWDYEKNNGLGIDPWEINNGSHTKVWWRCEGKSHSSYFRNARESVRHGFRCPECVQEREESFLQEKVRVYLEKLDYEILHEHKCTLIPINPKTKRNLPFDNEIKELKIVIEVHGKQHYSASSWHKTMKDNISAEYELSMRQLRDRYKRFVAYKAGYKYIAIPYWTDNKQEDWKQLINEILNIESRCLRCS